jgi:hypothetical protein
VLSMELSMSMSEVMLNHSRPAVPRPSGVPLLGLTLASPRSTLAASAPPPTSVSSHAPSTHHASPATRPSSARKLVKSAPSPTQAASPKRRKPRKQGKYPPPPKGLPEMHLWLPPKPPDRVVGPPVVRKPKPPKTVGPPAARTFDEMMDEVTGHASRTLVEHPQPCSCKWCAGVCTDVTTVRPEQGCCWEAYLSLGSPPVPEFRIPNI